MPRFNARGAVTPQIGYSWFDQDRFIFQDCSTGVCKVALSDGTLIAPNGVVRLLGNGHGVWAYVAFVERQDPTQAVYRDSFGRTRTNCYPQAIGPDGAICVKPHSNIGATVIEAGREWQLSSGDAQDIQLLGGGRAMWTEGGIVHANFPLIGNPGVPVWWPRAADDGALLYQSQQTAELVLAGRVIAPPSAQYFYGDVLLLDGAYHVCWSPSQSDTNAQVLTLTAAQLASLPKAGTIQPNPGIPPVTPIPPPVPPKPEPSPVSIPNQLWIVQTIRTTYPTPLGARHGEFLIAAARATGAKLLRKDAGSHVALPDGRNVSQDILMFGDQGIDFLSDAEGAAIPSWQEKGQILGEYYDVSAPQPVPEPLPQPVPQPPSADVLAQIAALKVRVELLESRKYRIALVPE